VGADGTLYEHPVDPERAAAAICRRVRGELTRAEWREHIPEIDHHTVCAGRP
jgi:hypothetical protein